jgi:hypothetical protein
MSSLPSPKKKRRRLWRWLGRAALIVLGLCVAGAAALWLWLEWEARQGRAQLAAVLAETDESDPRWRWEQIEEDFAAIPDAENSALVIKRLAASLGRKEPGRPKQPGGRGPLDDPPPPNVRLSEARLGLLREELADLRPGLTLAQSLKDYPRGRATVRMADEFYGTLVPHVYDARTAATVLRLDVERSLHEGQAGRVPDRVRATLRAGASLRDDPFFISAVVRVALRSLAVRLIERSLGLGELSDETCRGLIALLQEEDKENLLLPAARGERAGMDHAFRKLPPGKLSWVAISGIKRDEEDATPLERLGQFAYSFRIPEDRAVLLSRHNRICEAARLPVDEQLAACRTADAEWRAGVPADRAAHRRLLAAGLTPNVAKVAEAVVRDHALLRCAVTALAAERFRLAKKRWPKTLVELCPALLPAVPRDPFGDGPLRLAARRDGLVIYSVGGDGQDNEGQVEAPGLGQTTDDVGIRLYHADRRGLASVPQ